jgi:quinol monooxygenase YgiN
MSPAGGSGPTCMIIVAGHLTVAAAERASYLQGCVGAVEAARRAEGCLEFSVTADLLDPTRVVVYERWESVSAVEAFRASGPDDDQQAAIVAASVAEYDVAGWRSLTG